MRPYCTAAYDLHLQSDSKSVNIKVIVAIGIEQKIEVARFARPACIEAGLAKNTYQNKHH